MDFFDRLALATSIRNEVVLRTREHISSEVVSESGSDDHDGFSDGALVPRLTIHYPKDCSIRISVRADAILIETPDRLGSYSRSKSSVSMDEGIGGRMVLGEDEGLIVDRIVASIADFRLRAARSALRDVRKMIEDREGHLRHLRQQETQAVSRLADTTKAALEHPVTKQVAGATANGDRLPEEA
jgi:hypothetical protein